MEVHVHFIADTKIFDYILWPLVGFAQQKCVGSVLVDKFAHPFQISMRFR